MNMEKLKRFVALEDEKKSLAKKLETIKNDLEKLEFELIPDFVEDGVQSMNVDGRTVYIGRDVWAGAAA